MSEIFSSDQEQSIQHLFVDNYDLSLAVGLSKTEAEARRQTARRIVLDHIVSPEEAKKIILERLNMIYH